MAEQLRMEATVVDKATGPLKQIKASLEGIQSTPHMQRLSEDFKHLREHTDHLASGAAELSDSFGHIGVASLAASLSVATLVKGYKDLANRAIELRALSHETGLSADAINQLERAAQDFGVSGETVGKSLSTWADKMFDFRRGVGDLRAELNAQFPDVAKRMDLETPAEQLKEMEKLLAGMSNDPIRQKRWGELIFGNGDMARMFADGWKPFEDALKSAQERLAKVTPELQKQALELNASINAFNDSLDKLEGKTAPFVFRELKLAADDFRSAFEAVEKAAEWYQKLRQDPAGAAKDAIGAAGKAFDDKANEVGDRWRQGAGPRSGQGEDGNALRRNDEMPAGNPYDHPMKGHPNVRIIEGAPDPYAGLRHQSSYSTGAVGAMSPGLQGIIQAGVRAGVVQGLTDFSTMKDAESRVGGGGFQSAAYETWDGEGGGRRATYGSGRGHVTLRGPRGLSTNGSAAPHAGSKEQKKNSAESWAFWKAQGYSDAAAAGMLAMEQGESRFDPGARGDGGQAHGAFQWHPNRRRNIMSGTGINVDSASHMDQLRAAHWEMTEGLERKAGEAIRNARTARQAAAAGVYLYERPADKRGEAFRRGEMAEAWARKPPIDLAGPNRPSLWDAQKRAGMGPQSLKAEGGFHGTIELKGGPEVRRTSIRLYDMMDSVKIKRGPTMTTPSYEA